MEKKSKLEEKSFWNNKSRSGRTTENRRRLWDLCGRKMQDFRYSRSKISRHLDQESRFDKAAGIKSWLQRISREERHDSLQAAVIET